MLDLMKKCTTFKMMIPAFVILSETSCVSEFALAYSAAYELQNYYFGVRYLISVYYNYSNNSKTLKL